MRVLVRMKFLEQINNKRDFDRLNLAINEAKRFLLAAGAMQRSWQTAEYIDPSTRYKATVKRASMDLTHALSDIRRSPRQEKQS